MPAKKPPTAEWERKVKALIQRLGSEARVAVALGISQRTVNNYARGIHPPRLEAARRIDELIGGGAVVVETVPRAARAPAALAEPVASYGASLEPPQQLAFVEVGIKEPEEMDRAELLNEVRQLRQKVAKQQAQIDRAQEVLAGY